MSDIRYDDDFNVLKQKYKTLESQNEIIVSELDDAKRQSGRQQQYLYCFQKLAVILSDLQSDITVVFQNLISELKSKLYSDNIFIQIEFDEYKTADIAVSGSYSFYSQQILINEESRGEIKIAYPSESSFDKGFDSANDVDFIRLIAESIASFIIRKQKQAVEVKDDNYVLNVFQNKHIVMLIIDPETGEIFDANQAACEYYGWSYPDICAKNISEINMMSMLEMKAEMQKAEQEKQKHFNFLHRLANGEIRHVEVYSGPITYKNKNLLYSIIHDITDRKCMEIKLQLSEEKYRNIVESINEVVYEITSEGVITYISPSVEKVLGYAVDAVVGENLISFIYPEDKLMVINRLKTINLKDYLYLEYRYIRKDGSTGWVRSSTNAILKDGKTIGGRGTLTDITERKIIEDNLRLSEEKFSKAFSNSPFAFIISGLNDGKIIDVNDAFLNITGFSREEVQHNTIANLNLWADSDKRKELARQLTEDKDFVISECNLLNKNREVINVLYSASLIYFDNSSYLMTIISNITSQKVAEAKLKKSEELYRAIMHASPDVILVSSLAGDILMISPKALTMFGFQNYEQVVNRNILDFLTPESKEKAQNEIAKMFNGITSIPDEYKAIKYNGEIFDIEANADIIKDENGNPSKLIFIIREITDRKTAEEKLRLSEEKYRKDLILLNSIINSPVDIIVFSLDENYCYIAFSKFHALVMKNIWDVDIQLGMNMLDLIKNPEDREKAKLNFDRALQGDYFMLTEDYGKEDKRTYFENYYSAVKNSEGKIIGLSVFVIDATIRTQTFFKLEKSEERFRQLVEQSEEVVWEVDAYGLYTYVSPLAMKVYGYLPEQMIGKMHFYDLCPENEREIIKKESLEYFQRKEPFRNFIISINRSDGNEIMISTNGQPLFDEKGILLGYRGIDIDITERLKAEKQLKESEEKYRNFFENVQDVYYETTPEGIITEISPSIKTLTQGMYVREELINKPITSLYANPDDRIKLLEVLLKQGKVTDYEIKLKIKDGTEKYISIYANISVNAEGKPEKIFGSLRDITDRKHNEEKLKESEERYRFITERSDDLIFIYRLKPEIGFEYVSPSAERITGYTAEDHYKNPMLGMKLVLPDDMHLLEAMQKGILNNEAVVLRWIKKDGKIIWTELHNIPIYNENGDIVAIQGKATDISERKKSEQIIQTRLILSEFAQNNSALKIQQKLLDELELLTNSSVGFLYALNDDQTSFKLQSCSKNTKLNTCKAEGAGQHCSIDEAGVWEDCLKQKKAIIYNDHRNLLQNKALPDCKAEIVRQIIVPVFRSDKIVAFIGLGNKPFNYNQTDIEIVSTLADLAWDITERKGSEEKLLKLSLAVEQSPVIIYTTDLDGSIEYVNPKTSEISGYTIQEILGQNLRIFNFEEKTKEDYQEIWQTIISGKVWKGEFCNKKKNGELYWVVASISPLINSEGIITNFIAVEEDITVRKQTEDRIKHQNEKLNAIINAIPDLIFIIDSKGTYIDFYSSEANTIIPSDQIIGTNLTSLFDTENAKIHLYNINECIKQKSLLTYNYSMEQNGNIRYYEARMTPFGTDKVLTSVRDVTLHKEVESEIRDLNQNLEKRIAERTSELAISNIKLKQEIDYRKLTEQLLADEKQRLADVIKGTNVGTWQWNIQTGEILIDERWAEIIGFTIEELSPISIETWLSFLHPEDSIITNQNLERHFKGEIDYYVTEARMKHKKGHWVWISDRGKITKWNDEGKPMLMSGTHQDITVRKTATELIERTRKNYETFFNTIDDFLFVLDETGNIIHVNTTVITRLEYEFEELFGKSVLMVHPEERREEAGRIVGEMLAGTADFCPVPLVTKSGNYISVETRVKTGYWNEKPVIFGVTKDISKIKLSEEKFSKAFQTNSALMAISNFEDGVLIDVNNLFVKSLGFDKEEVIGKTAGDLNLFIDKKIRNRLIDELKKITSIKDIETEIRTKDGRILTGLFSADIIYVGKDKCMLTVMLDITERKAMEKALKESEARWNFALEGSGDGVWDWNAQTGDLYLSSQWKKLLGYNDNDAELLNPVFETWKTRVHPDDIEKCLVYLNKHLKGNTSIYMHEYRIMRKDGSYIWVLDRGKTIEKDNKNNPLRVIGTIADISDRKLFEQTLKQSIEREKELNDLKSRFVSMASHEFRTPLASILMYSDILISYWEKMDTIQIYDNLKVIKDQVSHLSTVVADVMQISKIQEGRINFNPQKNDIISLCNNTLLTFNSDIQLKNKIELISEFKEVFIKFDMRLIQQVLNNLISNAIKYSLDNAIIKVIVSTKDDSIQISVKDNGIGIPEENQKHLFEAFYRANNVNNIQGNGLGLNIVKESMKLHGGKVFVESEINKGSIFTISFPMKIVVNYNLKKQ